MTADRSPWKVSWETLQWESNTDLPMSRAQRAKVRSTYQAAVPAFIAKAPVAISPETLAASDDARAEISRFDAELTSLLPGTELAPIASILLRTESASSSHIENITVGSKALAIAELGLAKYGSNAQLVVANVDAMQNAIELDSALTPASILAIHETLMQGQAHAMPGAFRTEQVWIGGTSVSPHGAHFVPPHHTRVLPAIEDLCAFIARTDVPLLTQTAIAHAQFETIHPFNDGNGRTGRALVHTMLKHAGATTRTTIPVSAGLLNDTSAYFDALTQYRDGDPNPIVNQFTQASFAAINNGRKLAQHLVAVHENWSNALTQRRTASVWKALPLLLGQPAITSGTLQAALGLSQPAADTVITQLREARILTQASGGQRNRVWVAADVTRALDAFADRARRNAEH